MNKSNEAIMTASARKWKYIEAMSVPEPNSGCVLWLGAVNHRGYAVINCDQIPVKVSRMVLAKKLGRLPYRALHTCDVKCCIAEDHLYEGTDKDNTRDALNRGQFKRGDNGQFT